jgi:hypothetical protein
LLNYFNVDIFAYDQYTFQNVKNSIDNGVPMLGIVGPTPNEHAVMITGYNNDGTIEVYDSEKGSYAIHRIDDFHLIFKICSLK